MNRRIMAAALLIGLLGPAAARAAEADIPSLLRLGIVSASVGRLSGLPASDRLEPFRRRLAAAVQKPVQILPLADGRALVAALVAKRIDYAILSASAYAAAEATCHCLEPLAVPRAGDGATGWRAAIVVRGDAAGQTLADLKGKTLALPPAPAFAGRNYALAALAKDGLAEDGFRAEVTSGAEDAARAVLDGRADAALIWISATATPGAPTRGPLATLAAARLLPPEGLRPIWQSATIPHGPHVVRAALPAEWRARLRDTLIRLHSEDPAAYDAVEPEYGGGFAGIDRAAFDGLTAALPAR